LFEFDAFLLFLPFRVSMTSFRLAMVLLSSVMVLAKDSACCSDLEMTSSNLRFMSSRMAESYEDESSTPFSWSAFSKFWKSINPFSDMVYDTINHDKSL